MILPVPGYHAPQTYRTPGHAKNTALTADQSAAILTANVRAAKPFIFVRYGDGALECINGKTGMTRDREQYSRDLGKNLFSAFQVLMEVSGQGDDPIYVGDWLSASFDASSEYARYADQYAALIGDGKPTFLHFEALLLMRESAILLDFYRAVKQDPRKKLYMGPAENAGAAKMLGAEHLVTPMANLYADCDRLSVELATRKWDVLLYGAGMAGNIPVIECWEEYPERTYINLGSALDPLFMGHKSRRQQLAPLRARYLFRELL